MTDSNNLSIYDLYVQISEKAKLARTNKNMIVYKLLRDQMKKMALEHDLDDEFLTSTQYL